MVVRMYPFAVGAIAALVSIALFCYLWNAPMSELFKLPRLTFWQAFRLKLLLSLVAVPWYV